MPVMLNTLTETEPPTELKAGRPDTQRALRETEQLLDTLPAILVGLSQSLRVTRWNQMAGKVFGGAAAQTCGKLLEEAGITGTGTGCAEASALAGRKVFRFGSTTCRSCARTAKTGCWG
jgi:PAS domain-containing protein